MTFETYVLFVSDNHVQGGASIATAEKPMRLALNIAMDALALAGFQGIRLTIHATLVVPALST